MRNKNTIKILAIAVVIIIVTGIITLSARAKIEESKIIKEKQEQKELQDWLSDNCDCTEKERLKCRWDGFEVEGRRCVNEETNTFTNVLLGCSQYTCSEAVYNFNENKWELNQSS